MFTRKLHLIFLGLLVCSPMYAADNTYQVYVTQTLAGSYYDVSVWIGSASPEFVLATAGFKLSYNPEALGCPTKLPSDDGPWDQQTDADYANMTLILHDGAAVELHTRFLGGVDFTGTPVPSATTTHVGTIRFYIRDPSLPALLNWSQPFVFRLNSPGTQPPLEILYTAGGDFVPPDDQPLPITLASFVGAPVAGGPGVELSWRTLSEINNYGFTIQRRVAEMGEFVALPGGFVPGAGTTAEPRSYSFMDRTLERPGRYEYRLMQEDLNGKFWLSEVITVNVIVTALEDIETPIDPSLVRNYPNPFNPETTVQYGVASPSWVSVEVFTILGQKVRTLVNTRLDRGRYAVTWDGNDDHGQQVNSGTYLCRVASEGQVGTARMVMVR